MIFDEYLKMNEETSIYYNKKNWEKPEIRVLGVNKTFSFEGGPLFDDLSQTDQDTES